jgi:DNA polymerase
MTIAHLDIETRSTCDLKTAGLYRYFEDPETEVLVVRWRIGDGPVHELGGVNDWQLEAHIVDGLPVVGHNIAFDREGWNAKIAPAIGGPQITIEQTDCTMARCAALSLPQSLEQAGKALGLKIQKDVEGHRLMMKMCRPKTHDPITWHETPEQLERLSAYCAQDVLAECAIDAAVPQLSPSEKRLWVLDQKINARGVQLDMPMVDKALAVAERAALAASEQIYELTDGAVQRTTETAKIVKWLNDRGIPASSIAKGEQDELLVRADLFDDPLARQVIELRRASAKSSVAKYRAMQRSVCKDGRVRGTLNFHGASTGRWAGRLIQPQNLPRIGDAGPDVEDLHAILAAYDADEAFAVCQLNFENPLDILSKALRSMLIAKPGHELIGGDYSNIEGRVNAWLAGEDWKVEAFADFDAGVGPDPYNVMAGAILGKPHDQVTKLERLCPGKVPELACGYQGALRAFQNMAGVYGVHIADETALDTVRLWRAKNPMIVKSWYVVQDAAIAAVKNPGMKVPCLNGKLTYMVARNILWCRLPSGRPMPYVAPHIESGPCKHCGGTGQVLTFTPEERALFDECLQCRGSGWIKERVAFYGQNSTTKKWQKNSLYGGLQIENCCQAIARDILAEGMFRLEDAGYLLVLTVHDENICEVPEGFGSPEELAELMSIVPTWAGGLPVAVSAWKDRRYVK